MASTGQSFAVAGGGSGLPAPIWVKFANSTSYLIGDGATSAICDNVTVKVPLVDDSLIEEGKLYVQYGRVSERDYKSSPIPKVRPRRIKWYTSYVGGVNNYSGSGEIGGLQSNIIVDRPNLFQVPVQNWQCNVNLPYWAFYKTYSPAIFNGDTVSSGQMLMSILYMTGNKKPYMINPDRFLPTGDLYRKRPKNNSPRIGAHITSYWFARLVVVEEGRVTAYGPHGEALQVRPSVNGFDNHYMVNVGYSQGLTFKCTIANGYRQI